MIPVAYDSSLKELDDIFDGINGLFFAGGEVEFETNGTVHLYAATASYLVNKAILANK